MTKKKWYLSGYWDQAPQNQDCPRETGTSDNPSIYGSVSGHWLGTATLRFLCCR